jgi:hypothetical protein
VAALLGETPALQQRLFGNPSLQDITWEARPLDLTFIKKEGAPSPSSNAPVLENRSYVPAQAFLYLGNQQTF